MAGTNKVRVRHYQESTSADTKCVYWPHSAAESPAVRRSPSVFSREIEENTEHSLSELSARGTAEQQVTNFAKKPRLPTFRAAARPEFPRRARASAEIAEVDATPDSSLSGRGTASASDSAARLTRVGRPRLRRRSLRLGTNTCIMTGKYLPNYVDSIYIYCKANSWTSVRCVN